MQNRTEEHQMEHGLLLSDPNVCCHLATVYRTTNLVPWSYEIAA